MKLDDHHQRRLEATVQLLEESIARCRRWLAGTGEGILRVVQTSIDPAERERLLREIDSFHAALHAFAAEFELEPRPMNLAQLLNAEFSTAWVMLENCRPKRMKGYGVVFDPATATMLNAEVDRLLEHVEVLREEIVRSTGGESL
jgi:hypothetical protein